MQDTDLASHVGEMVVFARGGAHHRGRLLGVREDRVIVELPATLIRLSLSTRDLVQLPSRNR